MSSMTLDSLQALIRKHTDAYDAIAVIGAFHIHLSHNI